jgi:hypothetical protein
MKKLTLQIPIVDSEPDLGVANAIEANRDIFELVHGREQIAVMMERLLAHSESERSVTRQMIEKWFNRKKRTIPSGVMLVTLLTACELIREQLNQYKKNRRTTKPLYK